MRLVFLGPPGAGKGTMATRLAEEWSIQHISTGDIFRANINNRTELGKQVESILDSGALVPDDLTIELVRDRLLEERSGYILDGFPRTVEQADALAGFATIDRVLYFRLSEAEIVKRLSGRRVHKPSGRTYHLIFNPPKVAGRDDITGEPLLLRPDDEAQAIRHRLGVYERQTGPLVAYYQRLNHLVELDAAPPQDQVFEALLRGLS